MKKLFLILFFTLPSVFVIAQESADSSTSNDTDSTSTGSNTTPTGNDNASIRTNKYFISTNSGLKTPVGFRIGIIERMGGYIGMRFGKGYKYEEDVYNPLTATEATLFSATTGIIFPITSRNTFKVHAFTGIGFGKWFDRPSKNGQTVGGELEGGLMLSYRKLMVNFGGTVLTGDGDSAKGDMTLGIGLRF